MTTIAATLDMMAADSRVNNGETCYTTTKIYRIGNVIIGCAGHNEAIQTFLAWWPTQNLLKLRIPKRLEFEALVLSAEGLWVFERRAPPELVKDGVMAIGTGHEQALAAMDTMRLLKRRVDPRIAVQVACNRNPGTGGPVDFLRVKR